MGGSYVPDREAVIGRARRASNLMGYSLSDWQMEYPLSDWRMEYPLSDWRMEYLLVVERADGVGVSI